ncbi:MAG: hypothetical protein R3D32_06095 [Nitratireductor sp.]
MRSIGDLIVRLFAVAFAFVLATLAASMFLSLGVVHDVLAPALHEITGERADSAWLSGLFGLVSWPWVAASAVLPAAIAIAIAELMRWRGMTINLAMGGIVGLFAGWTWFGNQDPRLLDEGTLLVLASAGFVGGFVYWLLAGCKAGKWLAPAKPPLNRI